MELTLREVQRELDRKGQRLALSYSGGQYNAYVFERERLVKCERGDDIPIAVERAITQAPGSRPPGEEQEERAEHARVDGR